MDELIITEEDLVFTKKSLFNRSLDWVKSIENRGTIIHIISDIILFYLFFRYTQYRFTSTFQHIENSYQRIELLKKEYGLDS